MEHHPDSVTASALATVPAQSPPLPRKLAQSILVAAARLLVANPDEDEPVDFPNHHALASLALILPDNLTSLQQFVFINVPWCSFHDAARRGDLQLMEWWLTQSGMAITDAHYCRALYEASRAGHVHVLAHWRQGPRGHMGLSPDHAQHILLGATERGHLDVLTWWTSVGGLDVLALPNAVRIQFVRAALAVNCLEAAQWWLGVDVPLTEVFGQQFCPLVFAESAFNDDQSNDSVAMFTWLADNFPSLSQVLQPAGYLDAGINITGLAQGGCLHVLRWLLEYCCSRSVPLNSVFSQVVLQAALTGGQVAVLHWWKDHTLPRNDAVPLSADHVTSVPALEWLSGSRWVFSWTSAAVDEAESVQLLDWWLQHCGAARLKYTELAMDRASCDGRVDLLNWWLQHAAQLPLKYSSRALDLAAESGELSVLEWWIASELELKVHTPLTCATRGNHLAVMDWLWAHELYNKGAEEFLALSQAIECRHIEAMHWLESLALSGALGPDSLDPLCQSVFGEMYSNKLELGDDPHGLRWWLKHSTVLDRKLKGRLLARRRAWFGGVATSDGDDELYKSSDDEEETGPEQEWFPCIQDQLPYLDVGELEEDP